LNRTLKDLKAVVDGIEEHGILCKQITNMIPTINTACRADVSAFQNKLSSMKDIQGSCCDALLDWEALRCEFRAMQAAALGIIIET
jgi:peroxiredoxin